MLLNETEDLRREGAVKTRKINALEEDIEQLKSNFAPIDPESEVVKLRSEIKELKSCRICTEKFDEENRRPVKLSCPHILCESCAISVQEYSEACPFCRETFFNFDRIIIHP